MTRIEIRHRGCFAFVKTIYEAHPLSQPWTKSAGESSVPHRSTYIRLMARSCTVAATAPSTPARVVAVQTIESTVPPSWSPRKATTASGSSETKTSPLSMAPCAASPSVPITSYEAGSHASRPAPRKRPSPRRRSCTEVHRSMETRRAPPCPGGRVRAWWPRTNAMVQSSCPMTWLSGQSLISFSYSVYPSLSNSRSMLVFDLMVVLTRVVPSQDPSTCCIMRRMMPLPRACGWVRAPQM
mmetsp:Transcript_8597/g.23310  ORF Transcript_8597/g.23310 Transcript_8597/m.23310 type:complete len:240 (-) Transcript_8597:277-996(-)